MLHDFSGPTWDQTCFLPAADERLGEAAARAASETPEGGESLLDLRERTLDGWTDLLDRAGVRSAAEFALVRAMDGEYACSFPVERLSSAVLAVELDGEPLPVEHGGPARLVPTGEGDCWESVKWVARLELHATKPEGTARELTVGTSPIPVPVPAPPPAPDTSHIALRDD